MAKTPTVGVAVTAKVDERALQKSEQQVLASSQKTASRAADAISKAMDGVRVDPAKMMNPADFDKAGSKAGKAGGDSAAASIAKGDFAGAATTAAREFSMTFEKRARPKVDIDTRQTRKSGQSAGDEFADGFSGAAGIMRLAGKGGPIAGAIIAAGAIAVKTIQPMIQEAMQFQADIKLNQSKLGVNDAQMASVAKAAGDAWTANFGESIADNMTTATTAIQSGLLKATDGTGKQTEVIEGLQTIKQILGEEIPDVSRSAGQLIKTGLADNAKAAFDIITAGQREGLNVSGDWLDTIDEYSTQFRKLGLTGADAIGLLKQGLEGGARDTDVVADALKEFSIRAVDGSKQTTQAFEALGLNATDTADKLAQGGTVARDAFDQVLDRIRGIQDPLIQSKIAVALMGTQAEDLGAAFKKIDLSTAASSIKDVQNATQTAADTALKASQNEWATAGRNIESMWAKVKQSMNFADWFSGIPKAFNDLLADTPKLTPGAPGVPITGPRVQGPGVQGGITLPVNGAPAVTGGNPLDILRGGLPGGVDYKAWYPLAAPPPPPPPTQITPNELTDPSLAGSGGSKSDKLTLPTLPNTGPAPQDFLQQNGIPVTSSTFGAAQSVLDAQQHVAQLQSDVNTLEKANVDDQGDLVAKRNDLLKAQQDQTKALMSLHDSATSATDKLTKTVGDAASNLADIGANLDKDLGFSKGLPGLADNLVKFIASLAAAPLMGALAPIAGQGNGAYGALGMLFGGPSQTATAAAQGLNVSANGTRGGYPGDQALLSHVPAGSYDNATKDLSRGLADCSSAVEDLVNLMDGKSTVGGSLTTHNASQLLPGMGFAPGMGGPGDFRIGFNPNHMQATLPGGTPFNWGSNAAAAQGGVGGTGADDPSFTSHYYRPVATPPVVPSISSTGPAPSPVDIYSPANTNPGLNNPLPAPGSLPGGGGGGPGMGMPQGLPFGMPYQAQGIDYQDPGWQPKGGGGLGIGGGALGAAIQGAMSAGGMMPGGQAASAAAQTAMQAINRTIKFAGQGAGILAEGALDTFFPTNPDTGKNPMKDSWFWRAAGSLAGAAPAIGSGGAGQADKAANKKAQEQQGNPQQNGQQGNPQSGGPFDQYRTHVGRRESEALRRRSGQPIVSLGLRSEHAAMMMRTAKQIQTLKDTAAAAYGYAPGTWRECPICLCDWLGNERVWFASCGRGCGYISTGGSDPLVFCIDSRR